MNIKKVKFSEHGLKGASITTIGSDVKNVRTYGREDIHKKKEPVHLGLEHIVKDFRQYLLDLSQVTRGDMDKSDINFLIADTTVTEIAFDTLGFHIKGEMNAFDGKTLPLPGLRVEEVDDYEHFHKVMELISELVSETKEYLSGNKVVSDVEIAQRWIESGKDKSIDMDTFKNMTAEEQRNFCTKLLEEQFGALVLMNEDVSLEQVSSDVIDEIQESYTIGEEETVIPVSAPPKKFGKKKKEEVESQSEEF